MAVLRILKYGDPGLRRRASPVGEVTPEIRAVIANMTETMYDEVGIGLAAPQVGISLRLIVIADEEGRGVQAVLNPAIVEQGGETTGEEGCLSIPGVFAPVVRSSWVKVEARDVNGQPMAINARGLRARGQRLTPPPVKTRWLAAGLELFQPARVRDPEWPERFRALGADVAVVVAFGQILPKAALEAPRRGSINVYGSLLPRYRGAAPIQWAIMRGGTVTGITTVQMDEGMDTGPTLRPASVTIGPAETAA